MQVGTYFCESCPLAFEMTTGPTWTLDVYVRGLVCSSCGTMHHLRTYDTPGTPEGVAEFSVLFALPQAFQTALQLERRNERLSEAKERGERTTDWIKVGKFQDQPDLNLLTCNQCGIQGSLVDGRGLRASGSKEPHCPICKRPIQRLRWFSGH